MYCITLLSQILYPLTDSTCLNCKKKKKDIPASKHMAIDNWLAPLTQFAVNHLFKIAFRDETGGENRGNLSSLHISDIAYCQ